MKLFLQVKTPGAKGSSSEMPAAGDLAIMSPDQVEPIVMYGKSSRDNWAFALPVRTRS